MARLLPRVIVNFKTYPESTGPRAVQLARGALRLEVEHGVAIAVCPQAVDARACADAGARVYAQHFDLVRTPQSTGATSWEGLRAAGVSGTLLNHSEKRLHRKDLARCVEEIRGTRLVSVVCARTSAEARGLAALRPTMLAVEPPQLIGGSVSVTKADPAIVQRSVAAVHAVERRLPVLCGAGVKAGADARRARELGAHGVLVASGVTLARDPLAALEDLVHGLRLWPEAGKA